MNTDPTDSETPSKTEAGAAQPEDSKPRRKGGWIWRLGKLVLALVLLLVGSIVFLLVRPTTIPLSRFAGGIDEQVSAAAGRQVSIGGDIVLVTGMTPSLRISDVSVHQPDDWETGGHLIRMGELQTSIGLRELLDRRIVIDDVTLRGVTLSLETDADGKRNWEGLVTGKEAGHEESPPPPEDPIEAGGIRFVFEELGLVVIKDITVTRKEHEMPREELFALDRLEGSARLDEPLELDVFGNYLDLPYEGHLSGGTLTALRARSDPWPVELTGTLGDNSIHLAGHFSAREFTVPGAVRFEVGIPDLETLAPITGDLPEFGAIRLTGKARRESKDRFTLPDLAGTVGESAISGEISLDLSGKTPRVEGGLKISSIDLDTFRKDGESGATTEEEKDEPAEKEPIDAEPAEAAETAAGEKTFLLPVVGNLQLEIGALDGLVGGTTIRGLDLRLGIEETLATADLDVVLAEAPMKGSLRVEGTAGESVGFQLNLKSSEADLTDILAFYLGHRNFEGRFQSLKYDFSGAGPTLVEAWRKRKTLLEIEDAEMILHGDFGDHPFRLARARMERESPLPGSVQASGHLGGAPFELSLDYNLELSKAETGFRIHEVEGKLADVEFQLDNRKSAEASQGDAEFTFALKGGNLAELDTIYELNLPPLGPYSASGHFRKSEDALDLQDLVVEAGNSRLKGTFRLEKGPERPRLTLDLNAETIQLADFRFEGWSAVDSAPASPPSSGDTKEPAKGTKKKSALLGHDALNQVDATIALEFGKVLSGKDPLGRGRLQASLENSRLAIDPLALEIPGGSFQGTLLFHPKADGTLDWKTRLSAESFELGVLARRTKPDTDFSAIANVLLDAGAEGVPFGKLGLEAATGKLDLDVCPRNLRAGALDLWATNLIFALLPKLDPKNESKLNCLIARLRLENGVILPEVLGMDTTKFRVQAEGQVDLAGNAIELVLKPDPKRPQLLSLELPIGVKGTLAEPEITLGKLAAAKTVGRMAKNTLLFPVRIIASEKLPADGSDVCPCLGSAAGGEADR